MAESKVFFEREVQVLHDVHQFYNGDEGVVLVQAPSLLRAIQGLSEIWSLDPDETSNYYEGKKTLVVCDEPLSLPDEMMMVLALAMGDPEAPNHHMVAEVSEPANLLVAYKGPEPEPIRRFGGGHVQVGPHFRFGVMMLKLK